MNKALIALILSGCLSGCGLISTQGVYEEIRAQEKAKAVGNGAASRTQLPSYDHYQKERSVLSPEPR